MPDKTSELEERVRERAYLLWEREGRPEGRADEHWRRAAELEVAEAAPEGEGGRHTDDAEKAGDCPASAAATPGAARTAAKRRAPVGAGESVEAAPGAKRASSDGSSRRRAEPVDSAARPEVAQRQQAPRQRSQAPPRGSRRKGAAAEVSARAPSEPDEGGSRPPPR
jgi:DUF2934 family protein